MSEVVIRDVNAQNALGLGTVQHAKRITAKIVQKWNQ